jgi:hypothetical protein
VVNIPEDVVRVGEPSEVAGEQLSVMAGQMRMGYGAAATLVGKDEMNGRINPALEADDDLPVAEAKRLMEEQMMAAEAAGGGGRGSGSGVSSHITHRNVAQGHTAF